MHVIPTSIEVVSHSLPFPSPIPCFIPIPMGFSWDSRCHGNPIPMHISITLTSGVHATVCRTDTVDRQTDRQTSHGGESHTVSVTALIITWLTVSVTAAGAGRANCWVDCVDADMRRTS